MSTTVFFPPPASSLCSLYRITLNYGFVTVTDSFFTQMTNNEMTNRMRDSMSCLPSATQSWWKSSLSRTDPRSILDIVWQSFYPRSFLMPSTVSSGKHKQIRGVGGRSKSRMGPHRNPRAWRGPPVRHIQLFLPTFFFWEYLNLFRFFFSLANISFVFKEKSPSAENMRCLKEGWKSHIEKNIRWKSHLNENI